MTKFAAGMKELCYAVGFLSEEKCFCACGVGKAAGLALEDARLRVPWMLCDRDRVRCVRIDEDCYQDAYRVLHTMPLVYALIPSFHQIGEIYQLEIR